MTEESSHNMAEPEREQDGPASPTLLSGDPVTRRRIRRCAVQVLYQLDAAREPEPDRMRTTLDELLDEALRDDIWANELDLKPSDDVLQLPSPTERDSACRLALSAWDHRMDADRAIAQFAPEWPTYRQPVVDRSILRLAYFELTHQNVPPKVVIDEAIELSRELSTEKSPAFVNAVLDAVLRGLGGTADDRGNGRNDATSEEVTNGPL